jgi:hypothetical protein
METVTELWLPVKGFEGKYEVSSLGRVRSLGRMVVRSRGVPFFRPTRFLKPNATGGTGYPTVNFGGGTKYVHGLVLEAFVGPRPEGCEACHCNGSRIDNRVENLRWDTPQENQRDRAKHGTSNRGERCASAKLTENQAIEIRDSKEPGCDLARRYGVAQQTICNIRKGRRWNHIGTATAG